ncbi:uncharacterized protein G2W53_014061 [Senna tora]|uniref:Uncharacterized protein n=1 Tax=Senna tora TaxID=362788 RepID=A0A834TZT9_9FABA|nr:uncharacterized protein G2W53_014061 [Senna tora]
MENGEKNDGKLTEELDLVEIILSLSAS